MGDLSKIYDSTASAAVRTVSPAPATQPAPAPPLAAPAARDERLARLYDAKPGAATKPTEAPSRPSTPQEERLARMYDESPRPEAPSAEGASSPPGAAAEVEFTVPEGFDPHDPLIGEFRQMAGESKLDGKTQSRLFELHQRALQSQRDAQEKQSETWRTELEADPEVMRHADDARALVTSHGDDSLRALINDPAVGNHPGLVRFLVRVARELKGVRR